MNTEVGLWIDHKKAFVVFVGDKAQLIESDLEKHVRFSGGANAREGDADNQRDRQFKSHLNEYYDRVISCIGSAGSILIFGPGEAKEELKHRLKEKHLDKKIVDIEVTDKMTPAQVEEKTMKYFRH